MSSFVLVAVVIYHAVIALIGFGFAYLGFRFMASRQGKPQSGAEQASRTFLMTLRQLDPGYWFSLFGAMIVVICLLRGLRIDLQKTLPMTGGGETSHVVSATDVPAPSALLGVGMLVATTALVVLTAWYAWSNHRYVRLAQEQLQSQTAPCVVAFTRRRRNGGSDPGIEIVVKNFGQGIAKNVRFERSVKEDGELWESFLQQIDSRTPMSAIKTGISVLPPGVEIPTFWDAGGFNLLGGLHIVCKCERLGSGPGSQVQQVECLLAPLDPVPSI